MKAGDRVTLFNGDGADYPALIVASARQSEVRVRVEAAHPAARESPLEIVLAQGLSRAERMDYTVQKAVELGVARVDPVIARRSVVRLDAARARQKQAHWQAVAIGACEQCGRSRVPSVAEPETLDAWLTRWRSHSDGALGLLLDPASARGLRELPRPVTMVTLLAGPEGGFTDEESEAARRAGFIAVRLGPRVLRTETAALAALAAMQALWGDF
jgi:16S rRNA (uracil1498-N3)-methyltransferase